MADAPEERLAARERAAMAAPDAATARGGSGRGRDGGHGGGQCCFFSPLFSRPSFSALFFFAELKA